MALGSRETVLDKRAPVLEELPVQGGRQTRCILHLEHGKCYVSRVSSGLWEQTGVTPKGVWKGARRR